MRSVITKNSKETRKLAGELASRLAGLKPHLARQKNKALILALSGELGSGKTTFIKGFSKALGIKEKILSPTFVLIHRHKIKKTGFKNLYHIDAYRLKSGKSLLELGVKEILGNPENIVLIEWADRVRKIIPKNALWIQLKHSDPEAEPSARYGAGKNKRRIS
ncbi:MAG: tRNA (adenosine(37)-N6)-threonylcarbamoyltransferase complex ATPase subunit type 1 TsaE, partial [Parcubacteria group bacterium]|nr:tRNA (adenosine(37)-N6)-threonylcarbamoyltransferase complex ATPase subunit type 1 TsaE [Parcubacteria group bacterium]